MRFQAWAEEVQFARAVPRCLGLLLALLTLNACSTLPHDSTFTYDGYLIDGTVLAGHSIAPAPHIDLLEVSSEMRAFVRATVRSKSVSTYRFAQLMTGLVDAGYFINQYDHSLTQSAAATFAGRKGNCLAYTHLFVALAREADLNATYQLVDGMPTWNVESGYLIRNNHVNVVLRGLEMPGRDRNNLVVDFNNVGAGSAASRRTISDSYGASLHYTNIAMEHLNHGNLEQAFAHLKRGILTHAANPDQWINLGALYSVAGHHVESERAYRTALRITPSNRSAMAGLVKTLRATGQLAEAARYERRVERYQLRNPYYHFALAQRAYQAEQFEEAQLSVEQAIALQPGNASFYGLQGEIALAVGDLELAERSVELEDRYRSAKPADSGFNVGSARVTQDGA